MTETPTPRRDPAELDALRSAARATRDELAGAGGQLGDDGGARLAVAARRLTDSVLRPLDDVLDAASAPEEDPPVGAPTLWELAVRATTLRAASDGPPELLEATAALQDLACSFEADGGPEDLESRLSELRRLQEGLESDIRTSPNGPHLVTNAEDLNDWLGCRTPARPQMALCRCGASEMKPFCDGSHAKVGFTDEKSPDRVPDRRDTYVGQQVTVFDNRGICQHSGFCTDRLATVFHADGDPFVTPSGGRMDEIVRAVRDCPSGALGYAVDGVEAREDAEDRKSVV